MEQLSAKLVPIADTRDAVQLINADIDQVLEPFAFILAALTVGACVVQQLFEAMADIAHTTSTVAPGQRFCAYLAAAVLDSARVYHFSGCAPRG